jgi:hypothetical protein
MIAQAGVVTEKIGGRILNFTGFSYIIYSMSTKKYQTLEMAKEKLDDYFSAEIGETKW